MSPLISIIIPVYNREALIEETLNSVLNQTYYNWECIIVDDGSTDSSYLTVKKYIENKKRFALYKRPSAHIPGGAGARNFGFSQAKGEYILWLDSDDLLQKNKLQLQIDDLIKYNAELSISTWEYYPKSAYRNRCPHKLFTTKLTDYKTVIKAMGKEKSFFALHCFLVKRVVIERSGRWLEHLHLNDDGEFFSRVLINSRFITLNNGTNAIYRIHDGERISEAISLSKYKECLLSWKLIFTHLKLIDENEFDEFIEYNKTLIFNQLKIHNHKTIIEVNRDFFHNQIKEYNSIHSRYYRFKSWIYNHLQQIQIIK